MSYGGCILSNKNLQNIISFYSSRKFSVISVYALKGEMVVARFGQWPPEPLPDKNLLSSLWFGDGSQKMLACMTVWLCLLMIHRGCNPETLNTAHVQGLVSSMLRIPTIVKATEARGSVMDSVIARVIAQNINSKVQPITSFGWCNILKQFASEQSSFEEALQIYSSHPDVVAHDSSHAGAGGISLDGRKRQAVRNFMDKCSSEALDIISKSCHDLPFGLGAFGEGFASTNACFLGSKTNFEANPSSDEVLHPLSGETFVQAGLGLWATLSLLLLLHNSLVIWQAISVLYRFKNLRHTHGSFWEKWFFNVCLGRWIGVCLWRRMASCYYSRKCEACLWRLLSAFQ